MKILQINNFKNNLKNYIFFILCFTLVLNNTPKLIQMNFIGGVLGNKLSFYPFFVGAIYTIYCQYKYRNVFVNFDEFVKFILVYFIVIFISLLLGLYNYPYYDLVMNGPVTQIEKLPKVIEVLNNFGIEVDEKILIAFWMIARSIKGLLFEIIYTFCGAYMIYCWYHNDWKQGIYFFVKGILAGLVLVLGYGCIEIFYLAGNDAAKNILITLNPYIHVIKVDHNWWPPLLWAKQVRSVFPEPSHFGNYLAFVLPALWCLILKMKFGDELKEYGLFIFLQLFLFNILIFLTQARTAIAMFFGITCLFVLLLIYLNKKVYWKNFFKIILVCIIAFLFSLVFINNFINQSVATKSISNTKIETKKNASINKPVVDKNVNNAKVETKKNTNINKSAENKNVSDYLERNLFSLASSNKRSNGARYALIKSNLRIAKEHFFFGVGKGLSGAYISDNFTKDEKENREVKMWVTNQKKEGVLRYGLGAMNEYVGRLAETGFIGVVVFLFPFIFIAIKLLKNIKCVCESLQVEFLLLLTALVSVMAAGMNGSLNIFWGTWIVLGLCYAAIFGKKLDNG